MTSGWLGSTRIAARHFVLMLFSVHEPIVYEQTAEKASYPSLRSIVSLQRTR
jgi:hypothetical protein